MTAEIGLSWFETAIHARRPRARCWKHYYFRRRRSRSKSSSSLSILTAIFTMDCRCRHHSRLSISATLRISRSFCPAASARALPFLFLEAGLPHLGLRLWLAGHYSLLILNRTARFFTMPPCWSATAKRQTFILETSIRFRRLHSPALLVRHRSTIPSAKSRWKTWDSFSN